MTKRKAGLAFVFAWFAFGGMGHFVAPDFFARIIPPELPLHREAVYISGVFELLGAAGLLFSTTRRAAGIGLFILTIAVTPATLTSNIAVKDVVFADGSQIKTKEVIFINSGLIRTPYLNNISSMFN